jgi:hypothetical protein
MDPVRGVRQALDAVQVGHVVVVGLGEVGAEAPGHEPQDLRRGVIEPLSVVDETGQRLVLGDLGEQRQRGQPHQEPVRRSRAGLELGASIAAFDATDFGRLERFFDALPSPVDHLLVAGPGPHYLPLAAFDLDAARRDLDAHLLLPLQVARNVASKVCPGGTLLFLGGACGHRAATGIAFTAALTAALSAVTRDLALEIAPVRVNLIAAGCAGTLPAATRPVRRVVGPAAIAALAVHLMTNTAVTGVTFDIDADQQLVEG